MTGAILLEDRPFFFAWKDTDADALMTGWFGWDVLGVLQRQGALDAAFSFSG